MTKLALFIATLSLVLSLGANLTSYINQQHQNDQFRQAICSLVKSSVGGSVRRNKILLAANKLKNLETELPPGAAHDAVAAVEFVFRQTGSGSAVAIKRFEAELKKIGCPAIKL